MAATAPEETTTASSVARPLKTVFRSDGGDVYPDHAQRAVSWPIWSCSFGIGLFVAALLGLLIVLYVHNRFARLGSVDQSHADVRQLEQKLAVALEDRSKLQREIAAMKRDVEQTWAAERIESALLRERINDVAYEVVRITQALESPGSSIEPISAYATLVTGKGRRTQTSDIDSTSGEATAPTMHTGPLADRIRALRTTASRAAVN